MSKLGQGETERSPGSAFPDGLEAEVSCFQSLGPLQSCFQFLDPLQVTEGEISEVQIDLYKPPCRNLRFCRYHLQSCSVHQARHHIFRLQVKHLGPNQNLPIIRLAQCVVSDSELRHSRLG